MLFLYRIYQIFIMMPLVVVLTLLTSITIIVATTLFGGRWWGYYPAVVWARLFTWLTLVTVTVKGRENISQGTSYVFVANHRAPTTSLPSMDGWGTTSSG